MYYSSSPVTAVTVTAVTAVRQKSKDNEHPGILHERGQKKMRDRPTKQPARILYYNVLPDK